MSNNKILNTFYVITACGLGGFFAWDKFLNYQKTNTGLVYKIISPGDKNSGCEDGQFVLFEKDISYKNISLYSSNDNPDYPLAISSAELKKLNFDGEQFEALNFLTKKGEEGLFEFMVSKVINKGDIPFVNQKYKTDLNENSKVTVRIKITGFVKENQIFESIQAYRKRKKEENEKKSKVQISKDVKVIEKYLRDLKIRNFKVTESNLHYVVNVEGEGATPQEGDSVLINYTGKDLVSGKIFDSSIESVAKKANIFQEQRTYEPMKFVWSKNPGFIEGFAEGLSLLNKNCEATLFIPSVLAYGPRGVPGVIEENANLIFEVKIVDIIKAESSNPEPTLPSAEK
ncbi:MAG: FKBP-type peptidyl-prolyl cis-trans isomerase [Cytophagales bacterium]|jgi:FKBP-type peptidyl-prolyl cis-trans isomerase|nr:FKBP-type peptidyl-prolyl cis-trans isomerase [Cytophagales bacterium]